MNIDPELLRTLNLVLNLVGLMGLEMIRRILCERREQGKKNDEREERRDKARAARAANARRRGAGSTPNVKRTAAKLAAKRKANAETKKPDDDA